jgi:O-antigen ligase
MADEYSYQKFAFDPHNLVLSQLMTAGILGLVAFTWIVTRFYKLMFQSLQKSIERQTQIIVAAIIGSVTAFLVQGLFNPIVIVLWALFWLTLASGVSLIRRQID